MSRMIAVYGSPDAGKTTFAMKMAQEIYAMQNCTVIYISSDLRIPSLPILFPRRKNTELYSLGTALESPEVTENTILSAINTPKGQSNFGCLGYKAGENVYTYPSLTEDKIIALFTIVRNLADYIVVDCTCDPDDLLSVMALDSADLPLRLISPDLKSMAYFASQMPLYLSRGINVENHAIVLNTPNADLYMPDEAVKKHFSNIIASIPYSRRVKLQMLEGEVPQMVSDNAYRKVMRNFIQKEVLSKWQ